MVQCAHCAKRPAQGCAIYETRPQECREFECLWLKSALAGEKPSILLKPINLGAVLYQTLDGKELILELNPGVDWRKGVLSQYIRETSFERNVVLRCNKTVTVVRNNQIVSDYVQRGNQDGLDEPQYPIYA
jgi:Fe-S-cluster containining protein